MCRYSIAQAMHYEMGSFYEVVNSFQTVNIHTVGLCNL